PGTVELEDYDNGGEGVAYHDVGANNDGGGYRPTEGVDIETCNDTGGGFNVGWTEAGEWIKYSIDVATSGNYTLTARVARGTGGTGAFHIEVDGIDVTGSISIQDTGGWQNWVDKTANLSLNSGEQVIKFVVESGDFNINRLDFVLDQPGGNNPPAFSADPIVKANAAENTAYSGSIAGDASDPEADTMTFSKVSGPAWLNVAADGTLSGMPGAGDVGANVFTVQVAATGGSDTATLNLTVDSTGLTLNTNTLAVVNGWDSKNGKTFVEDGKLNIYTASDNTRGDLEKGGEYFSFQLSDISFPAGATITSVKVYCEHHEESGFGNNNLARNIGTGWPGGTTWLSGTSPTHSGDTVDEWDVSAIVDTTAEVNDLEFMIQNNDGVKKSFVDHVYAVVEWSEGSPNQAPAFTADPINKANADENVAYSGSVAADASDPEADAMTFSKVSGPAWLSVAANGTLSGTPGAGDVGANVFTVQVNATGGSDTATLNITVTAAPVNQPPAFTVDPINKANADENVAYSGSVAADASDPEGDAMTFSKVSGPAWLSVAANGTLSGTPGAGDVGANVFTIQVNAAGGSDTATLYITVDAAPIGWQELTYDDFESGWGNWVDGGADATLSGSFAVGSQCLNLQDNTSTSVATLSNAIDLSGSTQLKIDFSYVVQSFEGSEDFWVQYSDNGGSSWTTIQAFVNDVDFVDNGTRYYPSIIIDSGSYNFSSNAKIRFRCDASGDADDVYIDNVVISAQ
ncbi:MAG TPA: putative Ig domain-containing protein, partial [Pontiella sp.]|nr:putative Ig domain-containing protein [Pontiella sp.]